jgi:hypothetical protein
MASAVENRPPRKGPSGSPFSASSVLRENPVATAS